MFTLAEFTSRDGLSDADRIQYNKLTASLEADLSPRGGLEILFASEVLRAAWRLQKFAAIEDQTLPDDDSRAKLSRARASAERSLRWGMTELRRLQTDRATAENLGIPLRGLVSIREVLKITRIAVRSQASLPPTAGAAPSDDVPASVSALSDQPCGAAPDEKSTALDGPDGENAKGKKRTQFVPRNGPCPCGSGQKHKRCCGENAPPVPGDWLRNVRIAA